VENNYHIPVLYNECLKALDIKPDGVYVDCTFGGGGHSKGILQQLGAKGKLIAFDQDADAANNIVEDERFVFVPNNFKYLQRFLRLHNIEKVDGLLADLGVSSHQFDTGLRGFSIRYNGPLDMRMDQRQPNNAADVLKSFTEQQLHKMFELYGEVTNSKTLAKFIVDSRKSANFETIDGFKNFLTPVVKGNPNKYLAQVFQALRIEVNDELGALKEMLLQTNEVIKKGGRLAVITFHSLEDRLVKNFMRLGAFEEPITNPFDNTLIEKKWAILSKKPIEAGLDELGKNNRARSAKLRVAEKL